MPLKLGIILWTLHLCSHYLKSFWMFLLKNAMGRKFHHNYSQSEATNQRYRCKDGCSPDYARQGERWPLASSTHTCPLWRTQLGSGKVSSSNSSSRTSRTSSSSSRSDKTRQDNSRISGDTLAIPRRYPKMEKKQLATNPPHHFNTITSPNFKRAKPNTIQFPMEQVNSKHAKTQVKVSIIKTMFSKHKLDAARIDFHNSFPPTRRSKTCERIEFPSGEYRISCLEVEPSRKVAVTNLAMSQNPGTLSENSWFSWMLISPW